MSANDTDPTIAWVCSFPSPSSYFDQAVISPLLAYTSVPESSEEVTPAEAIQPDDDILDVIELVGFDDSEIMAETSPHSSLDPDVSSEGNASSDQEEVLDLVLQQKLSAVATGVNEKTIIAYSRYVISHTLQLPA